MADVEMADRKKDLLSVAAYLKDRDLNKFADCFAR